MVERHACDCGVPQVCRHHFAMPNSQKNIPALMQELISLEKVDFNWFLRAPPCGEKYFVCKVGPNTFKKKLKKIKVKHKLKAGMEKKQDGRHQQFYKQIQWTACRYFHFFNFFHDASIPTFTWFKYLFLKYSKILYTSMKWKYNCSLKSVTRCSWSSGFSPLKNCV